MRPFAVLLVLLTPSQLPAAAPFARPIRDREGYALPSGAFARLGSMRFRFGPDPYQAVLSPDGRFVLAEYPARDKMAARRHEHLALFEAKTGKVLRRFPQKYEGNEIKWSPRGDNFYIVGSEAIHLWDARNWKLAGKVKHNLSRSARTCISHDGNTLAIMGWGRSSQIEVVDTNGKQLASLKTPLRSSAEYLALSPNGKLLASWSLSHSDDDEKKDAQTLLIWDVARRNITHRVVLDSPVRQAAFSPDGKLLVVVTSGNSICLYQCPGSKRLRCWNGQDGQGRQLAFSSDSKLLALAADSGKVQVWDVTNGREVKTSRAPAGQCCSLVFTARDKLKACTKDGNTLIVWDVFGTERLRCESGPRVGVRALAFTGERELTTISAWGEMTTWDFTGKPLRHREVWPIDHGSNKWRKEREPWYLTSDGKYVATCEGERSQVVLRQTASGRIIARLKEENLTYSRLAFSPDGKTLAVAAVRKNYEVDISLWSTESGKRLPDLPIPGAKVAMDPDNINRRATVTFSADGKRLAVCWCGPEKERTHLVHIHSYDLKTRKESRAGRHSPIRFTWYYSFNPHLTLAPDGLSLTLTDDHGGIVEVEHQDRWLSFGDWEEIPVLRNHPRPAQIYSPDGRTVAANIDRDGYHYHSLVTLWEVSTGKLRAQFDTGGRISAMAFSPDGNTIAVGLEDGTTLLLGVNGHGTNNEGGRLREQDRQQLWRELASEDATTAYRAMKTLAPSRADTFALLREYVRPAKGKALTDRELQRLVTELADDDFDVREKAQAKLAQQGRHAERALRQALEGKPTPELRRRAGPLLEKINTLRPGPEERRLLRLFEVLHWQGGDRELLEKLAAGRADAVVTLAAKDALGRLGGRVAKRE